MAAGSGQFPEGTEVEIAAIPFEGRQFQLWSDGSTDNPRIVTMNDDILLTAQFASLGIDDYVKSDWYVYVEQNVIVIRGTSGHLVRIYDSTGRLLQRCQSTSDMLRFTMDTSGIYLIQLDNGSARKISIVKN